jgi:hypothetical protein
MTVIFYLITVLNLDHSLYFPLPLPSTLTLPSTLSATFYYDCPRPQWQQHIDRIQGEREKIAAKRWEKEDGIQGFGFSQ